ncbi:MAG: pilus assembly protein PilM [Opitutaceae bacterium]|nr:pilus assembly protein PilM [Opitutaceae bacterium]
MRITPRNLVVACGAAHVAVARFAHDRAGRLRLDAVAVEVHAAEPGTDARWIGQVGEALAAAAARENLHGPCRVALPGHLALTRLVAAPVGTVAERRSAEAWAVAQAMPHSLDDLAWAVRAAPGNGRGADLVMAAAKARWVDELGSALIAARLEPKQGEPAVLALVRAFRYNYADAPEGALVVDIGARTTSLAAIAPDGRFRVRAVALGGSTLTQALAESWGVDFTTAEARKRQWLDHGDSQACDDALAAAVAAAAEPWVHRLRFEIARTLAGLERDRGLPTPARVLLTGGGSLWPGLPQQLNTGLGLAVERYDSLRRVEFSPAADHAEIAALHHHLAVPVGLAATGLKLAPAPVDLLTPELKARRRMRRRRPWLLAAAVGFAAVWAGVAWQERAEAERLRRAWIAVSAGTAALRQQAEADAAAQANLAALRQGNEQMRRWLGERGAWAGWLGELQARLGAHGEVWLDRLEPKLDPGTAVPGTLRIEIGGWLLDLRQPLAPPGTEALARLQAILTDLAAMPQVAAVVDEHHDRGRPGRLGFGCTLVLAPDHRL